MKHGRANLCSFSIVLPVVEGYRMTAIRETALGMSCDLSIAIPTGHFPNLRHPSPQTARASWKDEET